MIITVWNGTNLHTIHSVVYKEVRKIFGELNIYTFVTYCYNKNYCLFANFFVYYSVIKKEIYYEFSK